MPGFATVQAYLDAMKTSGRYRAVNKVPTTQVAGVAQSFWSLAGMPAAGAAPTLGLAGAAKCDKDTVGAIEAFAAPAGKKNYLARVRVDRATNLSTVPGTYILCDRLAHAAVNHNQATGAFSPVIDGTDRLASGEGAQILVTVSTALSAASNTFSVTYTNQDGTTGRTTVDTATVASSVVNRVPFGLTFFWLPLQAGDTGARTITDWTLVSGTGTGVLQIALVKPLAWIGQMFFAVPNEREFGLQKQYLQEIKDGSCLFFIQVPVTIQTAVFQGGLTVVSG